MSEFNHLFGCPEPQDFDNRTNFVGRQPWAWLTDFNYPTGNISSVQRNPNAHADAQISNQRLWD
jgi:hypothetical protein